MKDDALAPVIAVMLILAAIVTFLSIYNAIYIPSMKESSEVEHLQNVESAFQHFSSDIDYAASSHQNHLTFSEPVQLGGGDFMFNLLRSSGTLSVVQDRNTSRMCENTIYNTIILNSTGSIIGALNDTLINFSYEPISNFWQDQGYTWQYGYLNVTKYGTLSTPLQYTNMSAVENATESGSLATFAESLAGVTYTMDQTEYPVYSPNSTNPSSYALSGNCSGLNLWAVNITADPDHSFISSNGYGTLKLTSNITSTSFSYLVTDILFQSDQEPFGDMTIGNLYNESFANVMCGNIKPNKTAYNPPLNQFGYQIDQSVSPVNVTLNIVEIQVEAY
ncbi:hypothetical protein [Methanoregula sp.]|uniref:hypothetical protein n=1 Tax=Methanoregula sp. TaxID=2052170 RepID=UPI003BB14C38